MLISSQKGWSYRIASVFASRSWQLNLCNYVPKNAMKKYCPPLPRTRSRPLYGHTFSCMVRFAALSDQWPLYESIYVTNKINRKSKSLKLTSIQLSLNRPYSSWILLPFLPFAHSAWYVNLSLACDNVNGPSVNQACHVKIKRNHCFQADSKHILLWNLFVS